MDKYEWILWGYGYVARALSRRLETPFLGSCRRLEQAFAPPLFRWQSDKSLAHKETIPIVEAWLKRRDVATVWLVSYPPNDDPLPELSCRVACVIYLSSLSVYGDRGGAWVFEDDVNPSSPIGEQRLKAEQAWQNWAMRRGIPCHILRLGGIYGPDRNALCTLKKGKMRVIHKPGHTFNRIHRDDVVEAILEICEKKDRSYILNLVDDHPAEMQEVYRYASALMKRPMPLSETYDEALKRGLTKTAQRFWQEHKRVSNRRAKAVLRWRPQYCDFKQGLRALWEQKTYTEN